MRPLPPSITQREIESAYPDAALLHCDSCHEDDLDYGAIEPVVISMPDGTVRTYNDSCCEFLRSLEESGIPNVDGFDYETGSDSPREFGEDGAR